MDIIRTFLHFTEIDDTRFIISVVISVLACLIGPILFNGWDYLGWRYKIKAMLPSLILVTITCLAFKIQVGKNFGGEELLRWLVWGVAIVGLICGFITVAH